MADEPQDNLEPQANDAQTPADPVPEQAPDAAAPPDTVDSSADDPTPEPRAARDESPAGEINEPAAAEVSDSADAAPSAGPPPSVTDDPDAMAKAASELGISAEELQEAINEPTTPETAAAAEVTAAASEAAATTDAGSGGLTIDQSELDAMLAERDGTTPPPREAPATTDPGAEDPAPMAIDQGDLDAMVAELQQQAVAGPTDSAADAPPTPEPHDPAVVGGRINHIDPTAAAEFDLPDFSDADAEKSLSAIELLDDVELQVKIELGRTEMYIEDVLQLGSGSVVELNKLAGDPVDIFVNEQLIARGEVLVLNDNFCVRINEILSPIPELSGPA